MGDDKQYSPGRYLPVKTDLQLAGGKSGDADVIIRPPWQGERCEAVLLYVTAWGNTAVNILYLSADSSTQVMGAAPSTLPNVSVPGGVWVINGAGSLALGESVIGVTEFLRVTPAAASSGQIYIGFYWRKVVDFAAPRPTYEPQPTREEEMTEENEVWRKVRGLPPKAYLQQNPGQLTKEQETDLHEYEMMTDMRNHLARKMPPGGRSAR